MHEVDSKGIEPKMWQLATEDPLPRTVVFIEKPEKAAAFAKRLEKDNCSVKLMTGTMRGFERDSLTTDPTFKQFLTPAVPAEPVWLVATSAGEVGVNLTCERLITELGTADHLLQRFGRLNRFGGDKGEAHVVFVPQKEERLLKTLDYLRSLDGDVSCRHVWEHPAPEDAVSERPAFARLEPWLIESWAQTTYHDREMPKVQFWLHGKDDSDPPQAELVWRSDVKQIIDWGLDPEEIERILQYYPIRPHERLREPASRILKKLEELGDKLGDQLGKTRMIRVDSDGSADIVRLVDVKTGDIDNSTLILPDTLGTLENGMFRPEPRPDGPSEYDVADREPYGKRRRFLIKENTWTQVPSGEVREDDSDRSALAKYAEMEGLKAPLIIRSPDEQEDEQLVYFGALSGKKKGILRDVPLTEHQSAVEERARQLAAATSLNDLAEQFARAGLLHDAGKARDVWQNAFGGSKDKPIAKSKAAVNLRLLNGYRHEFGSLIDARDEGDDLVLHLIASHHAGARPYFTERQFDREAGSASNSKVALDAARRYARLQRQYGAWGLAYLEAVFKAADGTISREEGGAASE
jgi:CRISPR-associated endonuclease/helicase Cas3